ncbi:hypothetical protein [Anaerocaecibacter muris]|uniref:hypothetical protein n=1 Tax=Anaerocaecibacter muris TaxID=2941513 RepID=UPI002040CB60|nr:hypothetical protein [Anaerocaecibacter muris]
MSKEKKRIKEQMLVNQAIASIKKQLNDLENSRKKYIAAAVTARECGIASQYNLAKNAIRIVTAQKTVVEQMLLNLQISAQIKDVSEMTKSFADGMKLLSGSITETAGGLNFEKVSKQMNKAMISTQMKQAESDEFLQATEAGFAAFAQSADGVCEDEIDRMIDGELRGAGGLDDELAELERKIKANKLGGNV